MNSERLMMNIRMSNDSRPRRTCLLLAACAFSFLPWAAAAQTDGNTNEANKSDADIIIGRSTRSQIRLAFPAADTTPAAGGQLSFAAKEVVATLRNDLEEAGIFNTQGPTELSVLTLTGQKEHDFEQYRSLGNEIILLVKIDGEGDRVVLEGRLYDLASTQSISGKRYRGLPAQARQIAHRFADEIFRTLSGKQGIAQTTLAFHSERDGFRELYLMDYDGHNQRRITGHRSTSGFPSWSPTGDAIAYMSYFSGSPGLYYVDLASSKKIEMYTEGQLNISPTFSPDGKLVAFAHSRDSNVDIYVCERECTQPRRLTTSKAIDTNPAWHPNGSQLAFTSSRSGRPNIYVMDMGSKKLSRVSFDGQYNEGATWKPDGSKIAYASRRDGVFQIAVTEFVSLTTRLLTSGRESHEEPTYSPDGRKIAFTIKRGRDSQIYVMDEDGSNWRQLTNEGSNFSPDWSPYP